ncbi:MAG: hypothetical protein DVB28_000141 [Verrucomicrobia bacterium]|nr:MAG: hypothetical protein DVB28_000141 [Verrucomicrobiota bacterium]
MKLKNPHAEALKIVVVEDNAALRSVMLETLQQGGHQATGVESTEEFLSLVDPGTLDVVIIDLNLPGKDGIFLAEHVRAGAPRMGIVMVTARVTLQDRVIGYGTGADLYLSKPIHPEELVAAVESLARRLRDTAPSGGEALQPLPGDLPPRLKEIGIMLINTGRAIKEIAEHLGIHEGTVRKHIERLYRSLGINSRAELSSRYRA